MLPALSEPIDLSPGVPARLLVVEQPESAPLPPRFLHFHAPAELVLMHKGTGRFICEAGELRFAHQSLVHAPAMAIHDFAFDAGARAWTLLQYDALAIDPGLVSLPAAPGVVALDDRQFARVHMLLAWLAETLATGAATAEIHVILHALLRAVQGALPGAAAGSEYGQLARFRPLLHHWEHSPGHPLDLAAAASLCSLSPAYFSRKFQSAFGMGFVAYQTRLRLQQAARLLAHGDMPVSQVAYRLGFTSHAYFSQCYKAAFGVSPSMHCRKRVA